MTVIWAWARFDLRRRWRSLVVLALLVAVTSGLVMTAMAGARRGGSAVERLLEDTLPVDAAVPANLPGLDWARFDDLPYVEARAGFLGVPIRSDEIAFEDWGIWTLDESFFTTIERPIVLAGRPYDPAAPDEAVVTQRFVDEHGKGVGDTVEVTLPSAAQAQHIDETVDMSTLDGPTEELRIVGVLRSPWFSDSDELPRGAIATTPAFLSTHLENLPPVVTLDTVNSLFRLENGAADIPQLRKDIRRITGRADIDVWDMEDRFYRPAMTSATFEARSLMAFGLAALLAALFLVGQASARSAALITSELQTAGAMGMTPRQRVASSMVANVLAALVGAALGVAAAIVASRWFPIGSVNVIEPDPGVDIDWLVLPSGFVATVLAVGAFAFSGAAREARSKDDAPVLRPSSVPALVARTPAPVPVLVGARFALERGRGHGALPVRHALLGAVVGVLGVIGALVFSHGVDDAIDHPERFGQTFQSDAWVGANGQAYAPVEEVLDILAELDYVTGVNDGRQGVATVAGDDESVTLWSYSGGGKPLRGVVADGRLPESAGEIMLASRTAERLDVGVGDTVELRGSRDARQATVAGVGFVPIGAHNSYSDGGWVTNDGYDALFTGYKFRDILVAVDGANPEQASARLNDDVPVLAESGLAFAPPQVATTVDQLRQVRRLPLALGGFLALLAAGAVGHAVATAVRRRVHDLAVLRAVGMTPWQSRFVLVSQAGVLVLIGLLFGIPLGLAAGRTVWRIVADFVPLAYVPPTALWALVLAAPLALLLGNLLAALPARRATSTSIATILRTE
ncbi:MAG: ABC transporter permease [Actinomycetota bacterium]|nr:ABC transporter permease [Actinomycetota bacterium]